MSLCHAHVWMKTDVGYFSVEFVIGSHLEVHYNRHDSTYQTMQVDMDVFENEQGILPEID